jgi:glutaredoxin
MDFSDERPTGQSDGRAPSAGSYVMDATQGAATLEVYWRPGCPYCQRLRHDLRRRGIEADWRNICTDSAARQLVRQANHGDETVPTVPTVRVGQRVMTNPTGAQVAAALPGHIALTSSAAQPVSLVVRVLSWLPTVGFIIASEVVSASGHAAVGYGLDVLALLGWWFTRPLRRR